MGWGGVRRGCAGVSFAGLGWVDMHYNLLAHCRDALNPPRLSSLFTPTPHQPIKNHPPHPSPTHPKAPIPPLACHATPCHISSHYSIRITVNYLKGWFAVDFISSIPFDVLFALRLRTSCSAVRTPPSHLHASCCGRHLLHLGWSLSPGRTAEAGCIGCSLLERCYESSNWLT